MNAANLRLCGLNIVNQSSALAFSFGSATLLSAQLFFNAHNQHAGPLLCTESMIKIKHTKHKI
jgi:hypothetical protein